MAVPTGEDKGREGSENEFGGRGEEGGRVGEVEGEVGCVDVDSGRRGGEVDGEIGGEEGVGMQIGVSCDLTFLTSSIPMSIERVRQEIKEI